MRRSITRGASTVLELMPYRAENPPHVRFERFKHVRFLSDDPNRRPGLWRDWINVGNDLKKAISLVEEEHGTKS